MATPLYLERTHLVTRECRTMPEERQQVACCRAGASLLLTTLLKLVIAKMAMCYIYVHTVLGQSQFMPILPK